ncbi:MAG TPA: calcium/sodium antiporter [Legionella sp.]|nr:calcium/sodium antiporter [Legionella sp.]
MEAVLILIISFIALIWAANHLVSGASGLAYHFNISPLVIGLTIVAIGTSAPELIFSILSSIKSRNDLVVGNAIGSNIANIGLVLGITILIKPITLNNTALKKAYPILIIAMLFAYSLILDGFLGKIDGCLFLISFIIVIALFIYWANQSSTKDVFYTEFKTAFIANRSLKTNIISILLGLVVVCISSRYLVYSSIDLARWAGFSDLTIGLTIVAIGTTLPELATSITAALKGDEDIAVGTILGSNIYNLLVILIFPAIIHPAKISNVVLWRDMPVMISLTLLLLFLNYHYKKNLSRWHGGILLLIYCSYIASIFIKANGV